MKLIQHLTKKSLYAGIGLCFIFLASATVDAQEYDAKKYAGEIKGFDKRDSLEKVKPGANLFVGSSTLRMWPNMQSNFPKAEVINRGFGGSMFVDLLYYADRAVMAYKPAKVFIYEGDNDIAHGTPVDVVLKQAKEMREKIAKALPGVPVAFISAKPSVARWNLKDKYIEFNTLLKAYCKKTKKTEFIDVWTPMLDTNGEVFKHVFLQDNLHMKPEGYQIWQKVISPYLIPKKG